MQPVSEAYKSAIADPGRVMAAMVSFDNLVLDDTYIIDITLDSSILPGSDFEIGVAPMDTLKLRLRDIDGTIGSYNFEGKEFEPEIAVYTSSGFEYVSLGQFTVEKAQREKDSIQIDAVDRMHKFEKAYINNLTYPQTLLNILQSACTQAGVTLATTTFANNNLSVPNAPVFEGVTCRKVIAQIAELAGGYAKINRQGQLEIITLGTTVKRALNKNHYIKFKRDDVATVTIDKVIVKTGDVEAAAGSGDHPYTILNNMFVQNPSTAVNAVYGVLNGLSYTACTLRWQGDMALDLNDKITIDGYPTYIFNRTLTYAGGLREVYEANAKSIVKRESSGKSSLTLDIEKVKTEIKVLNGEIIQKVSKGELGTEIVQNADSVRIAVGEIGVRNLLLNTNKVLTLNSPSSYGTVQYTDCQAVNDVLDLVRGKTVTTSIEARSSGYEEGPSPWIDLGVRYTSAGGSYVYHNIPIRGQLQTDNVWRRYYTTFNVPADITDFRQSVTWLIRDIKGFVETRYPKMYIGAAQTDWSAAEGELQGITYQFDGTGFTLKDDNNETLITPQGMLSVDNMAFCDNVQDDYPLYCRVYIDPQTNVVDKVLLRYYNEKFRAYSTGAASGGGSTISTTEIWQGSDVGIQTHPTTPSDVNHRHFHTVWLDDLAHQHSVTVQPHTHNNVYGIYEQSIGNYNIYVDVDGVERASVIGVLNGTIDLTQWITTPGWHTIAVKSKNTKKRFNCTLYIKSYIRK